MDSLIWASLSRDDGFDLHLRRQGWHLSQCKPILTDKQVLGPHLTVASKTDVFPESPSFFEVFGDTTARKLLRAIIAEPQTYTPLQRICGNEETLGHHLAFYQAMGFIVRDDDYWTIAPACAHVDNLGPTLEWYVAQWFRTNLGVPARHGVIIEGVEGELDVVAFVDGIRVIVECKAGKPDNITETDLRHFLQRAYEFNPEIAIFLVDTTSNLESPIVAVLNDIYDAIAERDGCSRDVSLPVGALSIEAQPRYGKGVYWGARHIYVVNTTQGIGSAVDAVLRHYHAHARHQRFPMQHGVWNFITGTVERTHAVRRPPQDPLDVLRRARYLPTSPW